LYKINKASILEKFVLRGNYLTKKILKNTSKQTLIFVRAPKHFNIGKRKVSSFVNYKKFVYNLNFNVPTTELSKNGKTFFKFFSLFHKLNILYIVNSVRISSKVKIK
jgi:hypothetical protein